MRIAVLAACIAIAFAQQPPPEWQVAARGKMSFEVASIKPDKGPFRPPNFPLDPGAAYNPVGGRFSADFPLLTYIQFAYKLRFTQGQAQAILARLPKWVASERFAIEARAVGNPTKDQMRLMMQSLLAERFHLKAHFETPESAVMLLTLAKPGRTGPKLRPHSEGPPCDVQPADPAVFPPNCDIETLYKTSDGTLRVGSRNSTIDLLAASLSDLGRLDRPVLDRTGLTGRFDYLLEWTAEPPGPPSPDAQPEPKGPTFLDAMREQLGLKLEPARAPVRVLIIDRVEWPSEN